MNARKHLSYFGYVLPRFSLDLFRAKDEPQDHIGYDGLNTRCYSSWPTGGDVVESWEQLASNEPNATAFHTPAWQYGVGRAYARVGRWRLITLSLGNRLLGALPLKIAHGGAFETPGEMISDYLDPLLTGVDHATAWRSILDIVKQQPGEPVREMVLHNVRHDAPCLAPLREAGAECGYEMIDEPGSAASRISLPATWDEFLARLSGHDRKELRRKIRNAEKAGARLEIHTAENGGEAAVSSDLDRIFSQMREVGGAKGIKAQWMYRPLFKRATPDLLRCRQMSTYNLFLNDAPAAGLICFPSKQGPMMWAGGWNAELRAHSPGIVLFGLAIRDSIEKGCKHFDLLRGQCRYKDELGAAEYPLRRITLRRAA